MRFGLKTPQIRIRTLLLIIALSALVLAGLARALKRPGRPYSTVFATFDPVALFSAQPVLWVHGVTEGGTFNMHLGGSFKEWRGFVKATDNASVPPMIQKAIEEYLTKACSGSSLVTGNLSLPANWLPSDPQPAHGLFLFNEGDRHGELHIWLFPDSSGSGVGYGICLQEEPLE